MRDFNEQNDTWWTWGRVGGKTGEGKEERWTVVRDPHIAFCLCRYQVMGWTQNSVKTRGKGSHGSPLLRLVGKPKNLAASSGNHCNFSAKMFFMS